MKFKTETKEILKVIIFIAILYLLIINFGNVINIIKFLFNIFSPFIIGACLAFIINIPMRNIEKFLCKFKKNHEGNGLTRALGILGALIFLGGILVGVSFVVIPQLIDSIELLIDKMPTIIDHVEKFTVDLFNRFPDIQNRVSELFVNDNMNDYISKFLNYTINGVGSIITVIISGAANTVIAIIFAIYLLCQKEYLSKAFKKIIYAYFKKPNADKIKEVAKLSNKTFANFISGQCVDAIILGLILFIALTIFRIPYAPLIAVLTCITALIPIFGAFISMAVGAIIIAIESPFQVILFFLIFIIIQQIEGNFIYPKVVGKSVSLPAMWTLLSITIGGSLLGLVGMLLALPITSIIYQLFVLKTNKLLKLKDISIK